MKRHYWLIVLFVAWCLGSAWWYMDGVKGVKTGYTPEAGYCLVTYLEYNDHQIIGVLLGSEDRRKDMKVMLDYSLKKLGITPPLHD